MSDESQLKSKKSNLKSKLTRFNNYFDNLDKANLTEEIIIELEERLKNLETILSEFNDNICELCSLNEDQAAALLKEEEDFENKFYNLCSRAKLIIKNASADSDTNSETGRGSIETTRHRNVNSVDYNPIVKLPPITIPQFDGKYCNWLQFKDAFISLIDQNKLLSDIEKFYYLRSSLNRDVLEAIQSIEVSAINYNVAWQFLLERYENKSLMIHNHIKIIFEYPKLSYESHVELRNLFDTITKHLRSLKSLGENTDSWDRLIIYILANKFDSVTRREWENHKYQNELPSLQDLNGFLKNKCDILEKIEASGLEILDNKIKKSRSHGLLVSENKLKCFYCSKEHSIYKCDTFLKLSTQQKIDSVKRLKLCLNCLRNTHPSWKCKLNKCSKCHKPHNTMLHLENINRGSSVTQDIGDSSVVTHVQRSDVAMSQVLLSTIKLIVKSGSREIACRALLDSGSQSNFISESFCEKLNLKYVTINHAVKGIGQILSNIDRQVNINIMSRMNSFEQNINCLVIQKITDRLPVCSFDKRFLEIPIEVELADPDFNVSKEIDILLGSEIFWTAIYSGQMSLGNKLPILQNTAFGWVVAGNMQIGFNNVNMSINCLSNDTNEFNLCKFWELEDVLSKKDVLSETEKYCVELFDSTTIKDHNGRYIVRIPFKKSISNLGNSKSNALNRFYGLERKLNKNPDLRKEYIQFMDEYISLNHMSEYKDIDYCENMGYYLPHHAVIKSTSLTTKLRTVFDASCKTTSGLSLNDVQFVGPTLQQDIFQILVRFRTHKYVMTGDVSKMYRQILIDKDDQVYQKIFWRSHPDDELKCYILHTLTYGTASAPYLAVKCLFDIAKHNEDKLISKIIRRDFYMDDLLTGANSKEELLYIQKNIYELLAKSGFELRKWLCNDKDVLNEFKINNKVNVSILNIGDNESNKTLGIFWNAQGDSINYKINLDILKLKKITKRTILSVISQIYDPLGLLGPIIIVVKLIIQDIWKLGINWDDELPSSILKIWQEFQSNITLINEFRIYRNVFSNYVQIELHGFGDASVKAYGACVYVRCSLGNGTFMTHLLCAKSRVAPVKQVSLPRLELCAAQLLANLVQKVMTAIEIKFEKYYFWSDSTITLYWIRGESSSWKTFVANRVSEIQSISSKRDWHYVRSEENPADLLSRGIKPNDLVNNLLWWHGPEYLSNDYLSWNLQEYLIPSEIPEQKSVSLPIANIFNLLNELSKDGSSFTEILHSLAYALRFIKNLKLKDHDKRIEGGLLPEEINKSVELLIKKAQSEMFADEFSCLLSGKQVSSKSKILSLNPVLKNDLICVGGRLKNANLLDERKYPIILPGKHPLTKYILEHEHTRLLHCGAQLLLSSIREKYWPIGGRNICRQIINKCLNCFKANPRGTNYLMGNLPDVRVNTYAVFENVGTDYGGPFYVKNKKGRGSQCSKAYLCLFVCMCTKAVHLEIVSELTTECFLAALHRFASRRGKPRNIYSDNGLNYVGANRELCQVYEFLQINCEYLTTKLADENMKWHFIPANSPTFGGLWEAGIKSSKIHIKRVLGNKSLTFEELGTLLIQIEGILNSRPLCPITEDPEDVAALTPAHFLIGRTITAIPEYPLTDVPENRLSRWQHIQFMVQHYWKRWQKEYLNELQTRIKWRKNCQSLIKVGSLVLIKDDNVPVLRWKLGRVTELHHGTDNIVRVISVKTQNAELKRGINRVCVLPIELG